MSQLSAHTEVQLAHIEEICSASAEILQLDEQERRQIVFEAVKDWVATDDIFQLFEQPEERKAEVEKFLAGYTEDEVPSYRTFKITDELLDRRRQVEAAFIELRDGLFSGANPEDASFRTLDMRIVETGQKTRYLELCVEHQKAVQENDLKLAQATGSELMELGKKFYGEVEPEAFENIVAYARENISRSDVSDIGFGEEMRQELLDMLPVTGNYEPLELGEVFDVTKEIIFELVGEYLGIIDANPPADGKAYTAKERAAVYELILQKFRDNGYEHAFKAVVHAGKKTEGVDQLKQEIMVAEDRGEPTVDEFRALTGHEVLRHFRSRVLGEHSDAPMVGISLPGYNITEEGMAKLVEQVINSDDYYEAGVNYMLIDGLSRGLLGDAKNKNEVFEIIWRKIYISSEPNSSATQEAARGNVGLAKEAAERVLERMYRIGSGEVPGVHYQKDIVYNNRRIWELYKDIYEAEGAAGLRKAIGRHMASKSNFLDKDQDELVADSMKAA